VPADHALQPVPGRERSPPSRRRFFATLRRLTRRRAALAIVGAPPAVAHVLELCAISGVELYPSVGDALSARPPSVSDQSPQNGPLSPTDRKYSRASEGSRRS
jgi:hypothetical protein